MQLTSAPFAAQTGKRKAKKIKRNKG